MIYTTAGPAFQTGGTNTHSRAPGRAGGSTTAESNKHKFTEETNLRGKLDLNRAQCFLGMGWREILLAS